MPARLTTFPVVMASLLPWHSPTAVHLSMALVGLLVGVLVGLTGAGGGALLTPLLILVFGLPNLAAVGSDLVTSLAMKPVGGLVHLHHRTVRLDIAKWLSVGSVPGAVMGVAALDLAGHRAVSYVRPLIGVVLLATGAAMLLRRQFARRAAALAIARGEDPSASPSLRRLPTVALGLAGGVLVGMTSVGSGTLMLAGLTLLYPGLTAAELVGTDLVQAIPLVGAAALAHLVSGDVSFPVSGFLMLGAVPGVYVGARLSSRTNGRYLRPLVLLLIVASGIKLL